jgi:hypothetical protein
MQGNLRKITLLIISIISFLSLRTATAIACVLLPLPTVLDAYEEVDVVIIARMVSIEKTAEPDPVHLNIRSGTMVVQKVFKGNVKVQDAISFAQTNGIDCLWDFDEKMIGHQYLLYLNAPGQASDLWYLGQGRSSKVSDAGNDLRYLENVEKVRGQTRVSGTLEDDFPLAGRKVRIIGNGKIFETQTDEHGVYEVYGLPPGKYFIAPELPHGWILDREESLRTVSDRPLHSKSYKAFTLKSKRDAVIDFALKIDNVVAGYVVNQKGRPLIHASIVLKPENDVGESSQFLDQKGRFKFESVSAGNYQLIVHEDKPDLNRPTRTSYYEPQKSKLLKSMTISIKHGESVRGLKIVILTASHNSRR